MSGYRAFRRPRRKALRAPGHKLSLSWSGEYGVESSSTGTCTCGWEESASSQAVVRQEYRWHLERVLGVHHNTDGRA